MSRATTLLPALCALAVLGALGFGWAGCAPPVDVEPQPVVHVATSTIGADIGFRSPSALADHFARHGREFGAISQAQYLARAQGLRDAPLGAGIIEGLRDDGVTCRFDRGSGAFLAFNGDRTIRTFFKPVDGEDYYRRQFERRH